MSVTLDTIEKSTLVDKSMTAIYSDLKVKNIKGKPKEKGITLIALVVTIIILLILAGVAISIATQNNGLFKKSEESIDIHKEASAREKLNSAIGEYYLGINIKEMTKEEQDSYLKETLEKVGNTKEASDKKYYEVEVDGYIFWVNRDSLEIESKGKGTSIDITEIITNPTLLEIVANEVKDLPTVTVTPPDATNQQITWSITSENPKGCVTIDSNNGKIKGVSKGTATITASTANGKTATCTITVAPEKIEGSSTSEVISKITGKETEPTEVTIAGKTVVVPPGFTISTESAGTVDEGIVVEDKNKNQWVWIPCYVDGGIGASNASTTGLNKYARYIFGSQIFDPNDSSKIKDSNSSSYYYTESLDPNDQASIRQFGGYYIGRYEAGDKESTLAKKMRASGNSVTNTVTIKKRQAPYNYVTYDQCVTLSNGIANANNYDTSKMYTKLCSSYAWDTALKFIGGNYATNSTQGNYKDTTFTYTDISGAPNQPKNSKKSILVPTGQTTAVKNIYDMGGNLWEYNSEFYSYESNRFTCRGGLYDDYASHYAAGYRGFGIGNASGVIAFRPTLYLK